MLTRLERVALRALLLAFRAYVVWLIAYAVLLVGLVLAGLVLGLLVEASRR